MLRNNNVIDFGSDESWFLSHRCFDQSEWTLRITNEKEKISFIINLEYIVHWLMDDT